jgi:hypothetical protein
MSVTTRLLGAIWPFVFVMMGLFTVLHVRHERQRLVSDLARRAVLVGEGVKESVEPVVRRESTPATARVLRRLAQFEPQDRGLRSPRRRRGRRG